MKKKGVLKVISVIVVSMLLILFFSALLTPTWYTWNNDSMVKGFYREKKDRLQVVFVGTSQSLNGIAPMELYRRYGICAYNLSSEQQPLLASYYWIKEAWRLHGKTLQTVVLDLSFVFQNEDTASKLSMNEKALTHMRFSKVKLEAYRALSEQYGVKLTDYLIPTIRYHSRWSSVTSDDFYGLTTKKNQFISRGQNLDFKVALNTQSADKLYIPSAVITEEIDQTQEAIDKALDDRNMEYVDQIVGFCREHDIDLVFIKIAKKSTDVEHDALQYVANLYDVPLIDFNLPSVKEEAGIDYVYDYLDGKHANVAGAQKITDYIGRFIVSYSDLADIRNDPAYDYMKEQEEAYQPVWDGIELMSETDLTSYLKVLDSDRYTVIVTVKGDAAKGFSDAQRKAFETLGFTGLKSIGENEAYVGVKSRGKVLADETGGTDRRLIVSGSFNSKNGVTVDRVYRLAVNGSGELKDDRPNISEGANRFFAESGGAKSGNISAVSIAGEDRSDQKSGINIAVYDHQLEWMIDVSGFNLSSGEAVRTDLSLPYAYQVRLDSLELKGADSIGNYIRNAGGANDCTLVICGTMNGEETFLTDRDRKALAGCGIDDGSFLESRPFILVIRNGEVLLRAEAEAGEPLKAELPGLINLTAEKQPGKEMTVRIGNETYKVAEGSVFAIAYNGKLGSIMNTKYFVKPA